MLPAARVAFVVYAVVLFYATHRPNLVIDGPIERTDLVVHVGAFGLWTLLLAATGWAGAWRTGLGRLRVLAIASVYAAADEASQAIPVFRRVFGFDDMAANVLGVVLAVAGLWALARLLPGRAEGGPGA